MTSDNLRAIADQVKSDFEKSVKRPRKLFGYCRHGVHTETNQCEQCDEARWREPLVIPHAVVLRKRVEQVADERTQAELRQINLRPLWEKIHAALTKVLKTGDNRKDIYVKFTTKEEKRIGEVLTRLKQAGYDASRDGWNLRLRFSRAEDPDQGEYELKNITINEDGEPT